MAVTSRDLRTNNVNAPRVRPTVSAGLARPATPLAPAQRRRALKAPNVSLSGLLVVIMALVLVNILLTPVLGWIEVKLDDLKYGRPRTSQIAAFVGHEEGSAPSHLVAMNVDRQVVITELPGGDPGKARTIVGPYLFGAGEDLTPVTLRLADVNNDSRPDLLVGIKQEEMVYINDAAANAFRIITAQELAQLQAAGR